MKQVLSTKLSTVLLSFFIVVFAFAGTAKVFASVLYTSTPSPITAVYGFGSAPVTLTTAGTVSDVQMFVDFDWYGSLSASGNGYFAIYKIGTGNLDCKTDTQNATVWASRGASSRVYSDPFVPTSVPLDLQFTGTQCALNTSDTYYVSQNGFSRNPSEGFPTGGTPHYWVWYEGGLTSPPVDPLLGTTHIASTTPRNFGIYATSTSFFLGVDGEVTPSDWTSDSYVKINIVNDTAKEGTELPFLPGSSGLSWILSVSASGTFSLSTTTDFSTAPLGSYTMNVTIEHKYFHVFGWGFWSVVVAQKQLSFNLSTSTTLATYTTWDYANNVGHGGTGNPVDYGATTTPPFTNCGVPFFNASSTMGSFVQCLFVPSTTDLKQSASDLYTYVFTVFPIGYVSRFVSILTSTTTQILPPLQYSFGSSSPLVLQQATNGDPLSFQIFDSAYFGSSSPLLSIHADDGTNKNVWDVIDPFVSFLCILGLLFVVLEDLLGFSWQSGSDDGYRDFSTGDINKALAKGGSSGGKMMSEKEYKMLHDNRL